MALQDSSSPSRSLHLGPRPLGLSKGLLALAVGGNDAGMGGSRKGHLPRSRTFSQQPRGVFSAAVPSQFGQDEDSVSFGEISLCLRPTLLEVVIKGS